MLAVDSSYDEAMDKLGVILGGRFSVDTAERINSDVGQAAGEFLSNLPVPERETEGTLLVASADFKGAPLVKKDAVKTTACEKSKKKPGNRRMATVASVTQVTVGLVLVTRFACSSLV